jgi:hypothetical protein
MNAFLLNMILSLPDQPHLTYCTNIHPGETWGEVRQNLERHVLAVKARLAPDCSFGIGLRLSSHAAEELSEPTTLEAFCEFLQTHGLYIFTINGFPYGRFHRGRVKDRVYLPDWQDEARLGYSNRLADILAALLPQGRDSSHSATSPPEPSASMAASGGAVTRASALCGGTRPPSSSGPVSGMNTVSVLASSVCAMGDSGPWRTEVLLSPRQAPKNGRTIEPRATVNERRIIE